MKIIRQLARFGIVGLSATLVHYAVAVGLIQTGAAPLTANGVAFALAFHGSFFCHYAWSFTAGGVDPITAYLRFGFVAVSGFAVSQTLLWTTLTFSTVRPQVSLIVILIATAGFTFLFSKYWAFFSTR